MLLTNLLFISCFFPFFLFEREETIRLFSDLTNDEALIIKHISSLSEYKEIKNNYKKWMWVLHYVTAQNFIMDQGVRTSSEFSSKSSSFSSTALIAPGVSFSCFHKMELHYCQLQNRRNYKSIFHHERLVAHVLFMRLPLSYRPNPSIKHYHSSRPPFQSKSTANMRSLSSWKTAQQIFICYFSQ